MEQNQCVAVRRDNREKIIVPLNELEARIPQILDDIHESLLQKAQSRRDSMTYSVASLDEMIESAETRPGFIKAMWCGSLACEEKLKELAGVSSRCIPFEQEPIGDRCVCCGKPAEKMVYWGKAY